MFGSVWLGAFVWKRLVCFWKFLAGSFRLGAFSWELPFKRFWYVLGSLWVGVFVRKLLVGSFCLGASMWELLVCVLRVLGLGAGGSFHLEAFGMFSEAVG